MTTPLTNVVVFTIQQTAYAVELRWIQEIFSLGLTTPVPLAPAVISNVVGFRGAILPILDISNGACPPTLGDGALLLEVDRCQAVLRVGTIDKVTSLPQAHDSLWDEEGQRSVRLLQPAELFRQAKTALLKTVGP